MRENPQPMATLPLNDQDLERLQVLLEALPAPLVPLDTSALDGFLCGVLLQPQTQPMPAERWLQLVTDLDGRPAPAGAALEELQGLVRRRHAELAQAIARRDWFDPWVYPLEDEDGDDASPSECVLPWVAGFAAAMHAFPALMALPDPELVEPLALLYMHFEPEDLDDAEALNAVIETLEPPADLGEAVQDIVRALMLIADVTRPRSTAPIQRPGRGPPARTRR